MMALNLLNGRARYRSRTKLELDLVEVGQDHGAPTGCCCRRKAKPVEVPPRPAARMRENHWMIWFQDGQSSLAELVKPRVPSWFVRGSEMVPMLKTPLVLIRIGL
jgi:hypothetical protein